MVQLITEEKPEPRTVCVLHHWQGLEVSMEAEACIWAATAVPLLTFGIFMRSCVHSTMLGTGDNGMRQT